LCLYDNFDKPNKSINNPSDAVVPLFQRAGAGGGGRPASGARVNI